MKRLILNLILLTTTIVGTIFMLTYDVHAEDITEVYVIPNDYTYRNYNVEFYNGSMSDGQYYAYTRYNYDFTVYTPSGYDSVLYVNDKFKYATHNYYYYCFSLRVYNETNSYIFNIGQLEFDKNNVAKSTLTLSDDESITIYIKSNDCCKIDSKKALKQDLIENNKYTETYITLNGLSEFQYDWTYGTPYSMTVNDIFLYTNRETEPIYIYIKNLDSASKYEEYSSRNENLRDALDSIINWRKSKSGTVFPEPELSSADINSSNDVIRLIYKYNRDIVPMDVITYDKVFVKLQSNNEWLTLDNTYQDKKIVSIAYNNDFKVISGGVNLDILYLSLGYYMYDTDVELPVIEGIIWGVRYKYPADENKYKNGYVNTSYIFSRYIFEDNIIEDTNISVDDLGNLTDINSSNNSTSGGGGSVNVGGSESPTIEQIVIDDTNINSMSDFINSLKWDFSSISNAISSVFSLVVQFAGFIGNIFSALFGEPFFIIVLIAIGCAIILRVVGR